MQTLRQHVSNIRNGGKLLSADLLISDRFIANELRNATNLIISQSMDKRKLWQSPNIFTPILCLEMEQVPLAECCEYTGDKMVVRSKLTLPQIGEGVWGLAIQQVSGVDNAKKFKETTPTRYSNLLKLNLTTNNVYYWVLNNRLYISQEDTEMANLYAYFTEDVPNNLLYPGKDCPCLNTPDDNDLCLNPLDKPFRAPANRLKDIEDIVIDRLNKTFYRIPEQKTSDNQEGN